MKSKSSQSGSIARNPTVSKVHTILSRKGIPPVAIENLVRAWSPRKSCGYHAGGEPVRATVYVRDGKVIDGLADGHVIKVGDNHVHMGHSRTVYLDRVSKETLTGKSRIKDLKLLSPEDVKLLVSEFR